MSSTQIAALTLRICGLYVWVRSLPILVSLLGGPTSGAVLVILAAFVGLGAVLFFGAARFARYFDSSRSESPASASSVADRQAIAYAVVGLYLFVLGMLRAGWVASMQLGYRGAGDDIFVAYAGIIPLCVLQLGLGAWLFLGSRGFVGVVRRFQGLGIDKPPIPVAAPKPNELQVVAFSVVGLYFAATGIDGLISIPVGRLQQIGYELAGGDMGSPTAALSTILVRIGLGAWLLLGSAKLASWWSRVTSPPPDPVEQS